MITREQYLNALEIVDKYHQQSKQNDFKKNEKPWSNLSVGDFVVFSSTMSKYIEVGKPYEVYHVSSDFDQWEYAWFGVIGEGGKRKSLRKYTKGYRMSIVPN